jgi:hypothetical protein
MPASRSLSSSLSKNGATDPSPPPSAARTIHSYKPQNKPKLLDLLREALRTRHYSRSTEATYVHWVKTMIYTHVLNKGPAVVRSAADNR